MTSPEFQEAKSHFTRNEDGKPSTVYRSIRRRELRRTNLEYRLKQRENRRKSYEKKKASCRLLDKEKKEKKNNRACANIISY